MMEMTREGGDGLSLQEDHLQQHRNQEEAVEERYSRQILFAPIGRAGQERLAQSRVLIVGMGALGTVLANHLVRAGTGFVRITDRDYVEFSNLQRQMLFDEEDAREALPKAEAAARKLVRINSSVTIEPVITDVTARNIEELAADVDLILDGTDNFQTRYLMNDYAFRAKIPYVYGGVVSSRGMSAAFIPGRTPCFRCLLPEDGSAGGETCDTVGVLSPVVDIVASYQSAEALKILTGNLDAVRRSIFTFDVWHNRFYELKFPAPSKSCPTCAKGEYPALDLRRAAEVTTMCGRDSVQITGGQALDLKVWQERLSRVGKVTANPYLMRVQLPEGERLTLFPDGRVLVQGTSEPARARTLYARYIGM